MSRFLHEGDCPHVEEEQIDLREHAGSWAEEMPTEFAIVFECKECGELRELTKAEWDRYWNG